MKSLLTPADLTAALPAKPYLMLDMARPVDEKTMEGFKCVAINEEFFVGHFPKHPIMPGVLQLESMKQLSELAMRDALDPDNKLDIYIKSVSRVKFRKPVSPGDRILVSSERQSDFSPEGTVFRTAVRNAAGACSEACLTLAARERKVDLAFGSYNEFDLSATAMMPPAKVLEMMPHRFPFLFIDYLVGDAESFTAVKNITIGESFFKGLDPAYPVVPESIICEIAAQAGCAAILSRPENTGKLGFFMAIEQADFHRALRVGDQLLIKFNLPPGSSRFGKGRGMLTANGMADPVAELSLMFAIVDP
ncbi:MAG: hypothetical protein MJ025_05160 [Victivallaceae bacterium]|nr:hypothetical protein [Victivallaceae bacterium]